MGNRPAWLEERGTLLMEIENKLYLALEALEKFWSENYDWQYAQAEAGKLVQRMEQIIADYDDLRKVMGNLERDEAEEKVKAGAVVAKTEAAKNKTKRTEVVV